MGTGTINDVRSTSGEPDHFKTPLNEDSAGVSKIWKDKAEELSDYVSHWVSYQDGMIISVQDGFNETDASSNQRS
ncbi:MULTISPECIES: hypothetical protein [Bifidobacterium]|jgi:hypothetical protein|uniref:Uncharacterized protein n=1 Tax=Bifidobacterium tibiigranuli TaxID=2172043 RepID=A0A5N6RYH7_9BIFI|nr:hypothetical protein [Bifidobacterium tibiigranuli]KAE8127375.1 hypothetical protein DDF78_09175 [Bifidobacterium tibiigranuli]KAE8129766.1 hypothetical protein DDE84_02955 [Bifidobacterium tibiigranuli]MCI1212277.1 hypothetical protein [Bifidobacterium tibiigranuli]MCI1221510.1 hypothetical protein [Bifidobacterium tibiigranuli]